MTQRIWIIGAKEDEGKLAGLVTITKPFTQIEDQPHREYTLGEWECTITPEQFRLLEPLWGHFIWGPLDLVNHDTVNGDST